MLERSVKASRSCNSNRKNKRFSISSFVFGSLFGSVIFFVVIFYYNPFVVQSLLPRDRYLSFFFEHINKKEINDPGIAEKIAVMSINSSNDKSFNTYYGGIINGDKKFPGRLAYAVNPFSNVSTGANAVLIAEGASKELDIYIGFGLKKNNHDKKILTNIGGWSNDSFAAKNDYHLDYKSKKESDIKKFLENIKQNSNNKGSKKHKVEEINAVNFFYSKKDNPKTITCRDRKVESFEETVVREVFEETKIKLNVNQLVDSVVVKYNKIGADRCSYLTYVVAYYPVFLGKLSQKGDLFIYDKNVDINKYTSNGYDDIEKVVLVSLSQVKLIDGKYYYLPTKDLNDAIEIEKNVLFESIRAVKLIHKFKDISFHF